MKDLIKKFWPYFSIAFVVLLFFWKFFVKGLIPLPADFVVGVYFPWLDYKWGYAVGVPVKNPMTTDVVSFTYPMQTFAIEQLKNRQLPLWNPLILAGAPLLANFQSSPFSPTNFVYFLFDKVTAWGIQVVLQHFLVALFTYFLLRWWKVSKAGSVFAVIIFAFSGYNLIWSQWNGHALSASFIPLILLFTDRFLVLDNWRDGVGISFATAFFFLSGYPQAAIYLALAIFLLWFFREKTKTFLLAVFFVLGIGLSGIQLAPGWELLGLSQRAVEPHPFEWAFLPFTKVITFIAPDFYGNHATKNYWGPQDYTSNTGFVGVVAFSLALFALAQVRKSKEVLFGALLAVFALILAFPTPVSIVLWNSGVFGLNAASAHRSLVLWNLAIAILAGFGFDKFKKKYLFVIPFIILAGFGIYALNIHQTVGLRNLILPLFALISLVFIVYLIPKFKYLLIPLAVLELFYAGWKFTPFSPRGIVFPTTPILEFLMNQEKPFRVTGSRIIPINMKMPYGLETVEGYDAIYPLRTAQFMAALNGGRSGTDPLGRYATVDNDTSPLLDLLNTKYYLTLNPVSDRFDQKRFKVVFQDKSVAVLESRSVLPRSFYVDKWEVIKDDRRILDKLLDPNFDFSKIIILEEEPPAGTKGFIFTSDTFYPGWKAYANGVETKIYRADFTFRAVPVSSSDTNVVYKYEPKSFSTGLKISVASLVLLLLVVLKLRYARQFQK